MAKKNLGANGVKNTSTKKSVNVSFAADVMTKDSVQLNAVTAAAVAGASSHAVSLAVGAGLASAAAVPAGRASAVADMMDQDIKVIELRQRIAAKWAAPRFEDSEDYKLVSAAVASLADDLRDRAINGARLAWLSRPENSEKKCTVSEVCEYISEKFAKEFRSVCGCAVPAASDVRLYSYSNLSVSNITADSDINDYLISSAVPAGLGASALVAVIMSVRVAADIRKRFASARAAARNGFRDQMSLAARAAGRLGLSAAVAARYFSYLLNAVPAADDKEEKRLRKNLASCWASLRTTENMIVLASPAGAFGALEDGFGGWCFPASLPASAPAKVRKLWAKRVRLLSDINTLNMLLSRC